MHRAAEAQIALCYARLSAPDYLFYELNQYSILQNKYALCCDPQK